ncbi:MAG: acyltransferase family protein [Bradymonadales bacterium]|nr:MAG: acyltransferase family protein [Bradymonadales bacterium]
MKSTPEESNEPTRKKKVISMEARLQVKDQRLTEESSPEEVKVPEAQAELEPTGSRSAAEEASPHQEDFDETKRILDQLGKELDEFHARPRDYDRKRLEGVMREFIHQLKVILADTGALARIQEALEAESSGLRSFFQKLPKIFRAGDVDDWGLDREFELAIKPFFDFMYYKYFRVQVEGVQNIPHEGRCLLVANHGGVIAWDGAMLKLALFDEHPARRELRFLVDDFVFYFPFMGSLMNRIGGVRACPENAERLLRQGEVVAVFPEGIKGISKLFKDRYRVERFGRGGVIRLAMKTKSPIVPVAVVGAEETYPLLFKSHVLARPLGLPFIPFTPLFPWLGPFGCLPLPTKWSIRFGPIQSFSQFSSKDLNDGILVNQETEKLRELIQKMLQDKLITRDSVFF